MDKSWQNLLIDPNEYNTDKWAGGNPGSRATNHDARLLRANIVRLKETGLSGRKVAELVGCNPKYVYKTYSNWQAGQLQYINEMLGVAA